MQKILIAISGGDSNKANKNMSRPKDRPRDIAETKLRQEIRHHNCKLTHWCEVCLKEYCNQCAGGGENYLICDRKKCRVDVTGKRLTLVPN